MFHRILGYFGEHRLPNTALEVSPSGRPSLDTASKYLVIRAVTKLGLTATNGPANLKQRSPGAGGCLHQPAGGLCCDMYAPMSVRSMRAGSSGHPRAGPGSPTGSLRYRPRDPTGSAGHGWAVGAAACLRATGCLTLLGRGAVGGSKAEGLLFVYLFRVRLGVRRSALRLAPVRSHSESSGPDSEGGP
jgi:hypothetical protein